MSRARLVLSADLDAWFDALDAHEGPGPETLEEFSQGLDHVYAQSQAIVHVITGSLKNSGRIESSHDESSWEGSLIYGGPSPGFPNDPVDYAIYEMARGDDHDFLRVAHWIDAYIEPGMTATVRARGASS